MKSLSGRRFCKMANFGGKFFGGLLVDNNTCFAPFTGLRRSVWSERLLFDHRAQLFVLLRCVARLEKNEKNCLPFKTNRKVSDTEQLVCVSTDTLVSLHACAQSHVLFFFCFVWLRRCVAAASVDCNPTNAWRAAIVAKADATVVFNHASSWKRTFGALYVPHRSC